MYHLRCRPDFRSDFHNILSHCYHLSFVGYLAYLEPSRGYHFPVEFHRVYTHGY